MGARTSARGGWHPAKSVDNARASSSRPSYLKRCTASASAPPNRYGASARAYGGGEERQRAQRRGRSAGRSTSSPGSPQSGHPAGTGMSVSAQGAQNGPSHSDSQDAQRSGKSRVGMDRNKSRNAPAGISGARCTTRASYKSSLG